VNAVEKSLSSTSGAPSPQLAPLPPGAPAEGRPLDAWLLAKLGAFLGDPALEFAIKDGARVGPANAVARVTFNNRATLLAVLTDPAMRFGDAYSDGTVTIDGDLVSMLEVVYRAGVTTEKPGSLLRRALRRPRTNTLAGSATSSIRCGSAARWPTRARTTRRRRPPSMRRRSPRWTTCAASCA
jgi:hypothetical protein